MSNDHIGFWQWLARGSGNIRGIRRIVNAWLILHVLVGLVLSLIVAVDLQTAGSLVLLPLAGILIGLSFAWAGNAQALMQSSEIDRLAEYHKGGFEDYVFIYQLAILTILVTVVLWGLAGLQVFDNVWPTESCATSYFIIKCMLFTLSSLALRECWHVVMGAQLMLLSQRKIKKANSEKKQN